MNCIHCENTAGKEYTHYVNGLIICGECGKTIDPIPKHILVYKGLTWRDGRNIHLYDRITPLSCEGCGTKMKQAFYDCDNDGALYKYRQEAIVKNEQ